MKSHFSFAAVLFSVLLFSVCAQAQYKAGKNSGGILLGFGGGGISGTGSIPPISVEYNFYNYEDNIQAGLFGSYSSSSEEYNAGFWKGEWSYTYIILAAQGNYHFMPGKAFDPFLGIALGYNIGSASWEWNGPSGIAEPSASAGGVFFSGQAGFNYWFAETLALQVRVGYYPYIAAGLTFGM